MNNLTGDRRLTGPPHQRTEKGITGRYLPIIFIIKYCYANPYVNFRIQSRSHFLHPFGQIWYLKIVNSHVCVTIGAIRFSINECSERNRKREREIGG